MTTWTLDHNTYKYYSTIGELIVWGDPEDGDEVVINNNFSYIFKPSSITNNDFTVEKLKKYQHDMDALINHLRQTSHFNSNIPNNEPAHHDDLLQSTNRMLVGNIEPGREETELEVYIREANQFR